MSAIAPPTRRRERLATARLYLVCSSAPEPHSLDALLRGAAAGGVDIVQLRDKDLDDDVLLAVTRRARTICDELGLLLIVNDRPMVALHGGADGVHLGQDDAAVASARHVVGPELLIGLSTHSPAQIAAANGVDYIGVGPVHATPTKPGRPAVGLDLVRHAAGHARVPFFAIGGIDTDTVEAVLQAGARRIAVVRAIAAADDPRAAAERLSVALASNGDRVGHGPDQS